eukprot:TRINITY_DN26938_c0_g1_i1.p1 TRINITY_DN26938_c0_g1~~TRINITY_DN26938_c0_g1_i1.p1  ORF type:complete len:1781 (+),score=277.72 TRINITY_DN26938_c0_g1_i1:67-5409(+)
MTGGSRRTLAATPRLQRQTGSVQRRVSPVLRGSIGVDKSGGSTSSRSRGHGLVYSSDSPRLGSKQAEQHGGVLGGGRNVAAGREQHFNASSAEGVENLGDIGNKLITKSSSHSRRSDERGFASEDLAGSRRSAARQHAGLLMRTSEQLDAENGAPCNETDTEYSVRRVCCIVPVCRRSRSCCDRRGREGFLRLASAGRLYVGTNQWSRRFHADAIIGAVPQDGSVGVKPGDGAVAAFALATDVGSWNRTLRRGSPGVLTIVAFGAGSSRLCSALLIALPHSGVWQADGAGVGALHVSVDGVTLGLRPDRILRDLWDPDRPVDLHSSDRYRGGSAIRCFDCGSTAAGKAGAESLAFALAPLFDLAASSWDHWDSPSQTRGDLKQGRDSACDAPCHGVGAAIVVSLCWTDPKSGDARRLVLACAAGPVPASSEVMTTSTQQCSALSADADKRCFSERASFWALPKGQETSALESLLKLELHRSPWPFEISPNAADANESAVWFAACIGDTACSSADLSTLECLTVFPALSAGSVAAPSLEHTRSLVRAQKSGSQTRVAQPTDSQTPPQRRYPWKLASPFQTPAQFVSVPPSRTMKPTEQLSSPHTCGPEEVDRQIQPSRSLSPASRAAALSCACDGSPESEERGQACVSPERIHETVTVLASPSHRAGKSGASSIETDWSLRAYDFKKGPVGMSHESKSLLSSPNLDDEASVSAAKRLVFEPQLVPSQLHSGIDSVNQDNFCFLKDGDTRCETQRMRVIQEGLADARETKDLVQVEEHLCDVTERDWKHFADDAAESRHATVRRGHDQLREGTVRTQPQSPSSPTTSTPKYVVARDVARRERLIEREAEQQLQALMAATEKHENAHEKGSAGTAAGDERSPATSDGVGERRAALARADRDAERRRRIVARQTAKFNGADESFASLSHPEEPQKANVHQRHSLIPSANDSNREGGSRFSFPTSRREYHESDVAEVSPTQILAPSSLSSQALVPPEFSKKWSIGDIEHGFSQGRCSPHLKPHDSANKTLQFGLCEEGTILKGQTANTQTNLSMDAASVFHTQAQTREPGLAVSGSEPRYEATDIVDAQCVADVTRHTSSDNWKMAEETRVRWNLARETECRQQVADGAHVGCSAVVDEAEVKRREVVEAGRRCVAVDSSDTRPRVSADTTRRTNDISVVFDFKRNVALGLANDQEAVAVRRYVSSADDDNAVFESEVRAEIARRRKAAVDAEARRRLVQEVETSRRAVLSEDASVQSIVAAMAEERVLVDEKAQLAEVPHVEAKAFVVEEAKASRKAADEAEARRCAAIPEEAKTERTLVDISQQNRRPATEDPLRRCVVGADTEEVVVPESDARRKAAVEAEDERIVAVAAEKQREAASVAKARERFAEIEAAQHVGGELGPEATAKVDARWEGVKDSVSIQGVAAANASRQAVMCVEDKVKERADIATLGDDESESRQKAEARANRDALTLFDEGTVTHDVQAIRLAMSAEDTEATTHGQRHVPTSQNGVVEFEASKRVVSTVVEKTRDVRSPIAQEVAEVGKPTSNPSTTSDVVIGTMRKLAVEEVKLASERAPEVVAAEREAATKDEGREGSIVATTLQEVFAENSVRQGAVVEVISDDSSSTSEVEDSESSEESSDSEDITEHQTTITTSVKHASIVDDDSNSSSDDSGDSSEESTDSEDDRIEQIAIGGKAKIVSSEASRHTLGERSVMKTSSGDICDHGVEAPQANLTMSGSKGAPFVAVQKAPLVTSSALSSASSSTGSSEASSASVDDLLASLGI